MKGKLIDGIDYYKTTFGKNNRGQNKWENVAWRKLDFPLYDAGIDKADIINFWKNKPVRFAKHNNCVGCFHRSPKMLHEQIKEHSNKFDWFINQEKKTGNYFKNGLSYEKIKQMNFTLNMFEEFEHEGCNSGFCGF